MPCHEVTMFVFTNQQETPNGTVRIAQDHIPWPGTTLMRYHMFCKNRDALKDMDYLFYSDADMLFVDAVGDEILGDTVATIHPGFYNKPRSLYTYEKRPESSAYIPPNEGYAYFAGGFNGGKTEKFLQMAETIKKNIDTDESRNIVAIWHDESHMNKFFSVNMPSNILNPSYCYPENSNIPFKKRLLALDKNHHDMRN